MQEGAEAADELSTRYIQVRHIRQYFKNFRHQLVGKRKMDEILPSQHLGSACRLVTVLWFFFLFLLTLKFLPSPRKGIESTFKGLADESSY